MICWAKFGMVDTSFCVLTFLPFQASFNIREKSMGGVGLQIVILVRLFNALSFQGNTRRVCLLQHPARWSDF